MKKNLFLLTMLVVTMSMTAAHAQTSKILFGWNFFWIDPTLNLPAMNTLFNTEMQSDLYQTGADSAQASQWSNDVAGTGKIIANTDSIGFFCGSQRMRYEGVPVWDTLHSVDTLTKYYFTHHSSVDTGYNSASNNNTPPFDHWQIKSPEPLSDSIVLSGNQFAQSWNEGSGAAYRLAISLQVTSTNPTNTNDVVDVYAIQSHYSGGTWVRDTGKVFGIHWNWFNSFNVDTLFYTGSVFHFTQNFAEPGTAGTLPDSMIIEVHSKRIVTTRIAFVCILDSVVFNLTAATDLSPLNGAFQALQKTCMNQIADDSAHQDSLWNHQIGALFLTNEPCLAQGKSMGVVNGFLNRLGNTELNVQWGAGTEARYLAQVQPKVSWHSGGRLQNQYVSTCPYLDYWRPFPAPINSWNYFNNADSSNVYSDAKTTACDTSSTDYFDQFDMGQGGWTSSHFGAYTVDTNTHDTVIGENCMSSTASYIQMLQTNNISGWWSNIFNDATYDSVSGEYGIYHSFPGDTILDTIYNMWAPIPEMCEFNANISLLQGAKGILFDQNMNTRVFPAPAYNYLCTLSGFSDIACSNTSDTIVFSGHPLQLMNRRLTQFGIRYSQFLHTTASILAPLQWRGAFARFPYIYYPKNSDYYTESTSDESGVIFADTNADVMQRAIVDSFPAAITNDSLWHSVSALPQIYPGDTSKYHYITMPDWERWLAEAFFSKDTTAISTTNPLFMGVMPLYCDCRDLYCRFIANDADTGAYLRRGSRIITTTLHMDTAINKWWRVTDMQDSLNFDTVVYASGNFSRIYAPSQLKLYRIQPAYSVDAAEDVETIWNNGRRSDFNGEFFHVALKNPTTKHVYYTRSDTCTLTTDPLAGFEPAQQIDGGVDSSKHPSIRSFPGTISIGSTSGLNLVGVVYEGRKHQNAHADSDLIYIKLALNGYNGVDSVGSYSAWNQYTLDSFMVSSLTEYDTAFEATPVLCPILPYDSSTYTTSEIGYLAAWSEGTRGIGMRAITFNAFSSSFTPATLGPIVHVDSGVASRNASFPTLTEREMTTKMINSDTADLSYEIDSGGTSQIYYRALFVKVKTTGGDTVTVSPYIREMVSDSTGCTNRHPNIDASHIMRVQGWHDYVPRVVWEGTVPIGGRTFLGVPRSGTYIYSAVRDTGGNWVDYAEFKSKDDINLHPSARVYETDSAQVSICNTCAAYSMATPMVIARPGGGSGSPALKVYYFQPSNIGWYTNANRLMTAQAHDGILPSFASLAFGSFIPSPLVGQATWNIGNWTDNGMTPTLEVNGRDTNAWANQRELFLATDNVRARVPILRSLVSDDTTVYYGKTLTLQDNTCATAIGIETHTSAEVSPPPARGGTPYLVVFQSQRNPLYPDVYLASDTLTVTPGIDTVRFISQLGPVDTVDTRGWVSSGGAKIKATLAVRSAATGGIIQTLDTLSYTHDNYLYQADTGYVFLTNPFDSVVYLTVSIDTAGVTNSVTRGFSVTEEYAPVTDTSGGFGKILNPNRFSELPSAGNMQAYPNPFNPAVSVAYQVSPDDGGGNVNVALFDIMGRQLSTLFNGAQASGDYTVQLNAQALGLPAGVYLVKIATMNHEQTKQIMLIK